MRFGQQGLRVQCHVATVQCRVDFGRQYVLAIKVAPTLTSPRYAGGNSSKTGTFVCKQLGKMDVVHASGPYACHTTSYGVAVTPNTDGSGKIVGQPRARCTQCKRQFSIMYFTDVGGRAIW